MLKIGLLGCGRIGQVHALGIAALADARIVAVADAMPEAVAALAGKTGARVDDPFDLIAGDDIDAVIVATPTATHFDLICAAAQAKKAIFCEKPVDLSTARIRDCLKIVSENGVPFMVGFNRRFDPNFAALERRLREGEIGAPEIVTLLSRDPAPPPLAYIKQSGGLFRDMMIHDFDMARFLLGEEPVEVQATGSCLVDPQIGEAGDIDTAAVTLKTASGRICQISNSRRASYGYDQRIEVHGARGMLRADNILEDSVELADADGFRRAPTQHFFLERYRAAYLAEMRHFIEGVMAGTALQPDGEAGLRAQQLADAAAKALETGMPQTVGSD